MPVRSIEQPSFRQVGELFIARPAHDVSRQVSGAILAAEGLRMLGYEELADHSAVLVKELGTGRAFHAYVPGFGPMAFTVYNGRLIVAEDLGTNGMVCTVVGVKDTVPMKDEFTLRRLARQAPDDGLDRSYLHMKEQGE